MDTYGGKGLGERERKRERERVEACGALGSEERESLKHFIATERKSEICCDQIVPYP
jgi:hypothetical protein